MFANDVALDCQVVLEVVVDDAWRDASDDALQSDVRLQRWLKELDDARLTHFERAQVNDCEA